MPDVHVRTTRDPWLDNAKMALVTLVVIGHAWALLPDDGVVGHAYDFLYAWHMPAFVLVTGYLSRGFDYAPERLWQLVRTLAVPYLVFESLMAFFRLHFGGEQLQDLFTNPHWPLWFLPALIFWRLVTPLFRALPSVLAVAVAVGLCVWSGTVSGETSEMFDLTRVIGLLPFFVLGVHITPERLALLRTTTARMIGVVVLGGLWLLTARTDELIGTHWLYYATPYVDLGASDDRGAVIRVVLFGIGVAGSLAFLSLVPRGTGWFTRMGAATLVVYLCHGFVIRGAEYAGFVPWAADHPTLAPAVALVGGAGVALALAASPMARLLRAVVDPFGEAEQQVKQAVELHVVAQDTGSLPAMRTQMAPLR